MPTLVLLGTGAAISDPHRTTTMLAFTDGPSTLLVDCGGDVIQRLLAAGIDLETISGLIITHEHPDHVSGFPLFMEKIWLAGRRKPIPVYGIRSAIGQAKRCHEAFNTSAWDMPEIQWHEVALDVDAVVVDDGTWRVTGTPGDHGVPVIGIRVRHRDGGGVVTYSSDTRPSERIVELARGSDILVHEATGEGPWHSSPEEAAHVAAQAGVQRLLLVHLPAGLTEENLAFTQKNFKNAGLGEELGAYTF